MSIFRKKALEHAEFSGRSDQLARIVPTQPWVMMIALWILLFACLLWGIFGKIPFRVSGNGLLLPKNGSVYAAVAPDQAGRIQTILVKPQTLVKKGQIVARLEQADLFNQIGINKKELTELERRNKNLNNIFNQQIQAYQKNILEKNDLIKKGLESELKALQEKKELLDAVQKAYERHLESKRLLTDTASNYHEQAARVEATKKELVENNIKLANFIDEKENRLRDLEFKIIDKRYELEKLEEKRKLSENVVSPINGIVTAISKNIGDLVKKGDAVVRIANVDSELDAIVFIPITDGKKIKVNMNALVSPSNIKKEEYGSIHGRVISVADYPSTAESMMAVLHNKNLVDEFFNEKSPIAIRISLKTDNNTPSGFSWSSSKGPDKTITAGTFVNARITIDEKSPLQIIIPLFKNLLVTEK